MYRVVWQRLRFPTTSGQFIYFYNIYLYRCYLRNWGPNWGNVAGSVDCTDVQLISGGFSLRTLQFLIARQPTRMLRTFHSGPGKNKYFFLTFLNFCLFSSSPLFAFLLFQILRWKIFITCQRIFITIGWWLIEQVQITLDKVRKE